MAITITDQCKTLFLKWTILVWLNAAVSFFIAINEYPEPLDILGIICGVFTFVALYTAIDYHLIKLREFLFTAVLIKALTQFFLIIEMITGALSQNIVNSFSHKIPFISTYLITLTDGILLSILVALLILVVKFIAFINR